MLGGAAQALRSEFAGLSDAVRGRRFEPRWSDSDARLRPRVFVRGPIASRGWRRGWHSISPR
ncbi:hypothetical protein AZ78_4082 [Lysobacter capsici AZ78]|uniref:Uncharacterized protein n=1 Tax=Lysobacter capsici AZ78 TaxID=1444315 RepID=A0A108UC76_9GAMM|nr:hypothetical protein AZ78_4082 [Lysobacter capsici AZ78]